MTNIKWDAEGNEGLNCLFLRAHIQGVLNLESLRLENLTFNSINLMNPSKTSNIHRSPSKLNTQDTMDWQNHAAGKKEEASLGFKQKLKLTPKINRAVQILSTVLKTSKWDFRRGRLFSWTKEKKNLQYSLLKQVEKLKINYGGIFTNYYEALRWLHLWHLILQWN